MRQVRAIRAAADALERSVGGPEISAGDREVCEVLFPAWRASSLAGQATTVAALFGADADSDLGRCVARLVQRASSERAARQALGMLLGRVQGVRVDGLVVRALGLQSGVATWDCSPL